MLKCITKHKYNNNNGITPNPNIEMDLDDDNIELKLLDTLNIIETLSFNKELYGWLKKLCANKYGQMILYKKRYVFIRGGHLIWHSKQVKYNAKNIISFNEMKKYNGFISLITINDITVGESKKKSGNSFIWKLFIHVLSLNGNIKKYTFRCDSKLQRDTWMSGLKKHVSLLMNGINQI